MTLVSKNVHPVCKTMRDLRKAAHISLIQAEYRLGISSVVLGSYERGDRNPPLSKVEEILNAFGYTLVAVPMDLDAVRLPMDMATELRSIADQLEQKNVVSRVPQPAAHVS